MRVVCTTPSLLQLSFIVVVVVAAMPLVFTTPVLALVPLLLPAVLSVPTALLLIVVRVVVVVVPGMPVIFSTPFLMPVTCWHIVVVGVVTVMSLVHVNDAVTVPLSCWRIVVVTVATIPVVSTTPSLLQLSFIVFIVVTVMPLVFTTLVLPVAPLPALLLSHLHDSVVVIPAIRLHTVAAVPPAPPLRFPLCFSVFVVPPLLVVCTTLVCALFTLTIFALYRYRLKQVLLPATK